jgi:hypothetical protein
MSIREFLKQYEQQKLPVLTAPRARRNLTAAGPAPMRLFSIPMRSSCLPNTWEQHEQQYNNQRLNGRHLLGLGDGDFVIQPPIIKKVSSPTRQTI